MLKKKPIKKPTEHDFSAVDAAVSELSKQTEALLGKAEPAPKSKPTLPKKRSRPSARGKSFDIIAPQSKKTTQATLKTVKPIAVLNSKIIETQSLLPDHATKSYNELDTPEIESGSANSAPAIIQHHAERIQAETELSNKPDTASEVEPKFDASTTQKENTEVSHTSLSFEGSSKEDEIQTPTEPEVEVSTGLQKKETPEALASEEKAEAEVPLTEKELEEPPAYNSGELFANNLVKDSQPKGYKPAENQQKPTVFDTNEYHPELHDWSKLEHKGWGRWLILVAVLCVLGGAIYFIFSGQSLPF